MIWKFLFFIGLISLVGGSKTNKKFDWQIANTSVWLSSGAYCPTEVYLNRTYLGYAEGFVPTTAIRDDLSDTQGYIGYMPEQSTIYIVLRGSTSFQNWIDDFDAVLIKYNGSAECVECFVHEGFNYAWNRVAAAVIEDVKTLRTKFPTYNIVVTGHSLGGALASLGAIALQESFHAEASLSNKYSLRSEQKLGLVPNIRLFTYGAPRFGNQAFSAYASSLMRDKNRVTHYRDMAPHCPPYLQYVHIEGEWYEDELGDVHTCEGPEDSDCSDRWYYTSISDHMLYLGLPLGCKSVSAGLYSSTLFAEPEYIPSAVPGSADYDPQQALAQAQKLSWAMNKDKGDNADKVPAEYAKKQPKPLLDTA